MLPQHEVIADLQDYAHELTEEELSTPIELHPTWPAQQFPEHTRLLSPVLVDVNGDGFVDVLIADTQGDVRTLDGRSGEKLFYYRSGMNLLAAPVTTTLPQGLLGVVIASEEGVVEVVSISGESQWLSRPGYDLGLLLHSPDLIDVNNDGLEDVLLSTERRGLVALDGAHEGRLLWDTAKDQQGLGSRPLIADINSDRQLDYIVGTDAGQVLAMTLKAGVPTKLWEQQLAPIVFAPPVLLTAGSGARGESKVLVRPPEQGLVALQGQTGLPRWQVPQSEIAFAPPLAADLSGDGYMDVINVSYDGGVQLLDGRNGISLWRRHLGAEVQAPPLLYDFNQDGTLDVLAVDVEGRLHIASGVEGRMLLEGYVVEGSDGVAVSPVLGDLNGDGQVDLVLVSGNGLISCLTLNRRIRAGSTPWPAAQGRKQTGHPL